MSKRASVVPATALVATVLAAHALLAPKIAGTDAFYHIAHAQSYLHRGLFDTSLPWATQSVIRDLGADLWWGFHMLLLPFAALGSVSLGIRLAALTLTFAFAGAAVWVLHRHRVPGAAWWTAGLLIAVPNVLFRLVMARPHVLSVALALVLMSVLVRGRWWHVLVVTAVLTWIHLGLFWMAPGVVTAYALVRVVVKRDADDPGVGVAAAIAAVVAGTVLGALLRPHPFAAVQLAWIQIVHLFAEKAAHRPLLFGVELQPLPIRELIASSWSFLLAWVVTLVAAFLMRRTLFGRGPGGAGSEAAGTAGETATAAASARSPAGPERALLATALLCSVVFLVLSVASARRALVEFVVFGFLTLPLVWSHLRPGRARRWAFAALAALLVLHLPWALRRYRLDVALVASPPDLRKAAAEWLVLHTEPGDIVFQVKWDDFGPLFAWDRKDRYLGGMDPIFQFAHDPRHYWEHFYLDADLTTTYTCDAFPCSAGKAIATPTAIRRDFGARWVLVEPRRNPKFTRYLLHDPHFKLAHDTRHEAIFQVISDSSSTSTPHAP